MRISFDLDDTLICYQPETVREPRPPLYRYLFAPKEPIRKGARSLMQRLREMGWEIWIYTTSSRRPQAVHRWLWSYGIQARGVINQQIHSRHLQKSNNTFRPSKNPRAFGIDLHVDNSLGVQLEGEQHGFPVIVVSPQDEAWDEKVLSEAKRFNWEYRTEIDGQANSIKCYPPDFAGRPSLKPCQP